MKNTEYIRGFLDPSVHWTSAQEDVHGIALVGSYARGEAREDSDIDFILLTSRPEKYLEDLKWIERFGQVENIKPKIMGN